MFVSIMKRAEAPDCYGRPMIRPAAFALGAVLASATANAMDLKPIQAASISLGEVTGVAYYTVEPNGYRVIATLAAGDRSTPMRFEAVLTDGQSLLVSAPGPANSDADELVIAREGNKLTITDTPSVVAIEE
jgi:hypothetical protein